MDKPRFLIDSNIAIYVLRDSASRPAVRIGELLPGTVVTSAIVYAEILLGIPPEEKDARISVERLFERVPVLPFDAGAAQAYARIPFKRARFDRLIAAHALSLGLTLVTNNENDFRDIPDLAVENWTQ
ncbi:type II toxin-antitoxin system VapC family toxin [Sphingomonas aliaeris]|uniref:Ribonuclease VapC n=1 Tax=Sphingomonas aliaeris TaxID=2759526 RepID=A0A974NSH9_9SPHN|nr:type II toxin-antitoxin system VapC family toxin [Sphingomonas aliaeris]QQV76081.1 type II toxin-antitoxin system VapC family toxin [Sphingomonas aliaeris]